MGLSYTRLDADEGPLNVPNASMLAAAVGPAREPEPVAVGTESNSEVADDTKAPQEAGQAAGASR